MLDVVQSFGHNGPGGGDSYVADLLRRTVEGHCDAMAALGATTEKLASTGASFLSADLPTMAVVHAQRCAELRWQMATAYLDGIVDMYRDHDALPKDAYRTGDDLCDAASAASRRAIQLHSSWESGERIKPPRAMELEDLKIDKSRHVGIWHAFEAIVDQIGDDFDSLSEHYVPTRLEPLVQEIAQRLRPHLQVFGHLRKEWYATSIVENELETVREAFGHVRDVFSLGQQLWALCLMGPKYAAAIRRKLTLDELNLSDPWILTDPRQRQAKERDEESRQILAAFWESITDVAAVNRLAGQVSDLLRADRIRRRTGRGYPMVPWPSQYLVRYPVSLGSASFNPGDLIAFYSSDDGQGRKVVTVRRTGRVTRISEHLGSV